MDRLKRIAPYFLIGPISGPQLAGVVFSLRGGRPVQAGCYGVALIAYIVLLPLVTARMGLKLI